MVRLSPKVLLAATGIYVGTSTATYLYLKSSKAPCSCPDHAALSSSSSPQSSNTFDRIAAVYDSKINWDETLMGIRLLRRLLLRQAEGQVLEVSAGTGRNLKYYSAPAVQSLTLTDTSREMLMRAREKHVAALEKKGDNAVSLPQVSFCLADVQQLCSSEVEAAAEDCDGGEAAEATPYGPALRKVRRLRPATFDTVVDTFGLCSCSDPVTALQEMAKAVRPGGKLLLLEHGKSNWDFLNSILDSNADAHLRKWGCQWNRDIEAVVRKAGLVVVSLNRWHFGTTYVITAQPGKAT